MPVGELDTYPAEGAGTQPTFTPPPTEPAPAYFPPALFPPVSSASIVSAATARVAANGGVLSRDELIATARLAGWPDALLPELLSQVNCESRGSPYGWNTVDAGLLGISTSKAATIRGSWFDYFGVSEDLKFDPLTNLTVGRWIYEYAAARHGYGWGPWSCRP